MTKRKYIVTICLVFLAILFLVGFPLWIITTEIEVEPNYAPLAYLKTQLDNQNVDYDGTEKNPTSSNISNIKYSDDYELSYRLKDSTDEFTDGCPVNAGTYDFKIEYVEDSSEIILTFTINKIYQVIQVSDLVVTYDKQTHSIEATLSVGDGELSYNNNARTIAGSQVVTITASETTNYLETTTTANLTINQKEATLIWTNTTLNYSGGTQAPTCTVGNLISGDVCSVTVTGGQTTVGTHTATASSLSNNNYCLPANNTTSFIIKESFSDITIFELKFTKTDSFMYRLGNGNNISLSSLFKLVDGVEIPENYATLPTQIKIYDAFQTSGSTFVQINGNAGFNANISQNSCSSTTVSNINTWLSGSTIRFSGTGVCIIELKVVNGNTEYSKVQLVVEVVNGNNVTDHANGHASATSTDIILLNSFSTASAISVTNNHTLYGNGFTISDAFTNTTQSAGMIELNNGTLDNVIIQGYHYPTTVTSGTQNQYYQDCVMVRGNAWIYNSFISGRRSAVHVQNGTLKVFNSTIDGGAYSNLFVDGGEAVYLTDCVFIQEPKLATTGDTTQEKMGVSIYFNYPNAHLYLEGDLRQYCWVTKNDTNRAPSPYNTLLSSMLSNSQYANYKHNVSGTDYVCLGIIFQGVSDASRLHDNRTTQSKSEAVYSGKSISMSEYIVYYYSYSNSPIVSSERFNKPTYESTGFEYYKPTFTYNDSANYVAKSGDLDEYYIYTNGGVEAGRLEGHAFVLDLDVPVITKYGRTIYYQAYLNDVAINDSYSFTEPGTYYIKYVVASTEFYNLDGTQKEESVDYEFTLKVVVKRLGYPKPVITMLTKGDPLWVKGGSTWDADYGAAIPILEGLFIEYYDNNGNYQTYSGTGQTVKPSSLNVTYSGFNSGNATEQVYNGKLYVYESKLRDNKANITLTATYTITDPLGQTATLTVSWSVASSGPTEVKEKTFTSDSGGGGGDSCLARGTMITLADGSKVKVEDLTGDEMLLVWNFETGTYDVAPIVFIDTDPTTEYNIIRLFFDNGSNVDVIYEHGFFDMNLGKYVYITEDNYTEFIGHEFMYQISATEYATTTLVDAYIETRIDTPYSPVTFGALCYFVDDMLSMPGGISGLFNIFDVDTTTLMYDLDSMALDINTYGMLSIEDYNGLINEYAFDAFNGKYLGIAVEKGLITWDDIAYLAERYGKYFWDVD